MPTGIIVLTTSPRLPAGLLTAAAWDAVRTHPVFAAAPSSLVEAVRAEGITVTLTEPDRVHAPAVWLAAPDGPEIDGELLRGSWDPPGARLLDVAAVMDRLRSPGGCPWDAEQTHESLRQYLLEEAYEAYDALLDGDREALREELGDVLLQVAFHARIAAEYHDNGFDIDDVAGDLVAKLIRRHPHVFADRLVSGSDEVNANWDEIKKAEKRRESALDGVARSQPALALAAKYLSRTRRAAVPVEPPALPPGLSAPTDESELGALLLALVAATPDLDAESALRAAAHAYAADVRATEAPTAALPPEPRAAEPDVRATHGPV